jgi:branched-chain amino acid transport system permease protein
VIFGVTFQALAAQLTVGLINGLMYAALSLGLSIIFGLLHVINFAHGTFFMLGGLATWAGLRYFGLSFWPMLLIAPLLVGLLGVLIERVFIRRVYGKDYLYGLMLTLGFTLVIEGAVRAFFGVSGNAYGAPPVRGVVDLGFMILPAYRAWMILLLGALIVGAWAIVERTRIGSYLRAAKEDRATLEALGVDTRWLFSGAFLLGVALAAAVGVIATPVIQIGALTGESFLIIAFATVVIGGMGSLSGTIIVGIGLGLIQGLTKTFYPPAAEVVVYVVMMLVLLLLPRGLFGE